jgi:hypothetical protein
MPKMRMLPAAAEMGFCLDEPLGGTGLIRTDGRAATPEK